MNTQEANEKFDEIWAKFVALCPSEIERKILYYMFFLLEHDIALDNGIKK